MRRLIFLLGMFVSYISFYAAPVKLVGCTPTDGSAVNEFSFTLTFDISEAIADLGSGDWGLGYYGDKTIRFATLYKGTKESGTELAKTNVSNFNGKNTAFEVNNNKVTITFPSTIIPIENQVYTLVVTNNFLIFPKDKAVGKTETMLECESSPLVYSFTGKKASSESLALQDISVTDNTTLESVGIIKYTFNAPISVNSEIKAQVKEGEVIIAEANSMTIEEGIILAADFGEDIPLSYGHSYKVYLPEGAVALSSDATQTNKAISVNVKGNKYYTFGVASTYPSEGDKVFPIKASITYNLPEGTNIVGGKNQWTDKSLKIYKSEISDESLITTLYASSYISDKTGLEWDLSRISFEPSTVYILLRGQGVAYLFDSEDNRLPEWTNEETKIRFSSPSVEEANFPQLEFDSPYIGEHGVSSAIKLADGMKVASIPQLEIAIKDKVYAVDGVEYRNVTLVPKKGENDKRNGFLYEITPEGDVLVKEFPLLAIGREDTYETYSVINASVAATLYDGKEYRIVIPAGSFTIPYPRLYNYVQNQELSYVVKGTTPTEAQFIACSVEDGAEMSELINVVWTVNGEFNLVENAEARINEPKWIHSVPVYSYISNGNTYLTVNCCSQTTGNPVKLSTGKDASVTLPAGILVYPTDESITNKEVVVNIKGKTAAPVVVEPEFVTVDVTVNGIHSTSQNFVKGKSLRLQLAHDDWEVESLRRFNGDTDTEGSDITEFVTDGAYTSSAVKSNTRFAATLKYAKPLTFSDTTTGIAELPESNIRVYSDSEAIVVEGLEGGEHITVYTTSGMTIGSHEVASGKDTVRIAAGQGNTYIVRVRNSAGYDYAAKILH